MALADGQLYLSDIFHRGMPGFKLDQISKITTAAHLNSHVSTQQFKYWSQAPCQLDYAVIWYRCGDEGLIDELAS